MIAINVFSTMLMLNRSYSFKAKINLNKYISCNLIRRNFSNKRYKVDKNFRANNTIIDKNNDEQLPQFSNLLRQFYRRSHPDVLRSLNVEYADINDQSWQLLNGILSTLKESNTYPPRMIKTIPFYIINKENQTGFECIELNIKTDGGDCKKKITTTLQDFFIASKISIDGKFHWGKEYFPVESVSISSKVMNN